MSVKKLAAVQQKRLVFTAAPLAILLTIYAVWLFQSAPGGLAPVVSSAALVFLFALLGINFVPRWINAWSGNPEMDVHTSDGRRSGRFSRMHPFFGLIGVLALFRLLLFVAAYLFMLKDEGYTGGIFDHLEIWNGEAFDSRHYLSIAENWYASEGNDRLLLVFFPFYPLMVRICSYVFQNYLVSGLFISNLACIFGGWMLYELVLLDHDRSTALRSVKYFCILPAAVLLSAPVSDALFFLLSVSCIFLARRKSYPAACVLGFFAAFTRLLGVVLAAPVLFEIIGDIVRDRKDGRKSAPFLLRDMINVLSVVLIPMGLLLYLYINYRVSGNALQFFTYQSENWQQGPGWFFNTAAYQTRYAISAFQAQDWQKLCGLWLPNLCYLFGSVALLAGTVKSVRPSYTAYFIAYFLVSMGATWLLSAPRYMTACFPVALAMALITKKRWADWLATLLCLAGLVFYLYAFIMRWNVY